MLLSPIFQTFTNSSFVLSILLVGARTYPALEHAPAVVAADMTTGIAFCLEVALGVSEFDQEE